MDTWTKSSFHISVTEQKNNFFPSKNQDSVLHLAVFLEYLLWVSSVHHLARMRRVAFPTTPAIWKTLSISFFPINSPSALKSHGETHPLLNFLLVQFLS